MSSVSRWAETFRSITLSLRNRNRYVVLGFFGLEAGARDPLFTFKQELSIPGWCTQQTTLRNTQSADVALGVRLGSQTCAR